MLDADIQVSQVTGLGTFASVGPEWVVLSVFYSVVFLALMSSHWIITSPFSIRTTFLSFLRLALGYFYKNVKSMLQPFLEG